MATAVGLIGAAVLQCGGEAMTSVTTTLGQLGPEGTTAENKQARELRFQEPMVGNVLDDAMVAKSEVLVALPGC